MIDETIEYFAEADELVMQLKQHQYRLRISDEELDMLDEISTNTGMTKADILRKGLRMVYNLYRYS